MISRIVSEFPDEQIFNALCLAYPQRVAEFERTFSLCINDALPRDVLVLILSHCWRNTLSIMCVCKAWHNICTTDVAYWRRGYYETMTPCLTDGVKPEMQRIFWQVFTTFDDEIFPMFRDKTGWMFHDNNLSYESASFRTKITIQASTYNMMIYIIDTSRISSKRTSKLGHGKMYIGKTLYSTSADYVYYEKQMDYDSEFYEKIEWRDKNLNLKWVGTGLQKYGVSNDIPKPIPYGDGTWSRLDTGEILLSGKDVAHRGLMDDDGKTYHRGKRIKTE